MAGQGCSVVVVSWPEVTVEGRLRTRHDTKPRAGALTIKQLVNDKRVRAPLPPSIPPSLPPPPWPRINGFVTGICPETLQLPSTLHLTLLAAVNSRPEIAACRSSSRVGAPTRSAGIVQCHLGSEDRRPAPDCLWLLVFMAVSVQIANCR